MRLLSPSAIFFHQMVIDSILITLYGIQEQKPPSFHHELSKSSISTRIIKVIFLGTSNDEQAPLGTGAMLLIGFGAAYAMKKRKEA